MVTFRQTTAEDLPTIGEWIARDSDHAGIEPRWFAERRPGVSCWAIEDEEGPVIFVREEHEDDKNIRLHTQFAPDPHRRVARALEDAYPIVAADAKSRGYSKIRFESGSIALVRFMFRFGFRAELVAEL